MADEMIGKEIGSGSFGTVRHYSPGRVVKWLYKYTREEAVLEFAVMDAAHECGVGPRVYKWLSNGAEKDLKYGIVVDLCSIYTWLGHADGVQMIPKPTNTDLMELEEAGIKRMGYRNLDVNVDNVGMDPSGRLVILDWSIDCVVEVLSARDANPDTDPWKLRPRSLRKRLQRR
jgi:hypothetical protein